MTDMWDQTTFEFGKIFDRVSRVVRLRRTLTAAQINNRMEDAVDESKERAKSSKVSVVREYEGWNAEQLDKLVEQDFAGRAIYEANKNPEGIISLTLQYGREQAEEIMHEKVRSKVRASRGFRIARGGRYY